MLVVVGAGVSIGATSAPHASWLGLLKHGIEYLVATDIFKEGWGKEVGAFLDAAFSPFDLKKALQHAELVEQNLTMPDSAAFARWLESAFADLRIRSSETLEVLRELQQAGALLLTTNYDSLLSEATGLPPVTWEEHDAFFQVVRGQRRGILHIHGHWERPSSVVLGKSSYERIVQDQRFQDLFRSLWLERSWLYVGCGDGLDDPNLGRLLEWGNQWKKGTPPDYFLATADKALALAHRPDKPANLVSFGYADHSKLPEVLRSLAPIARCSPFVPVDVEFSFFRSPAAHLSVPFPSRQEYLNGEVPALDADAEVRRRLEEHGWAFVLDVASVGKTTLALRIATAPERRDHPVFYLDLAAIDPADADAEATTAMRRLARPASLLILDNVHYEPEIARQLWDQWRSRPRESNLLLIATRMQRSVTTAPAQDLGFFEHHVTNPAIELRPTPEDLGAIVRHIYRRIGGSRAAPLPTPPASVLQGWYQVYGSALGAFCFSVLGRLVELRRGNWDLPLEAASDWVREKWIKPLDAENLENVLCLAVFGSQELELEVQREALPHPGRTHQLSVLVAQTQRGQFGEHHRFKLREPGWGRLLLAAQIPPADEEEILFATAARHPMLALALSARLRRGGSFTRLERCWAYIAGNPDHLVEQIPKLPLAWFPNLVKVAEEGRQPLLEQPFWEAIERDRGMLVARAWETPLHFLASFLETAKRHQRDTASLWEAIEREPDRLATRALETPLELVSSFLDTAKRHKRDTVSLWEAIEREPDRLATRALGASLHSLASFLETAKRHQRNTAPLWEAIERDPRRLAASAWETTLDSLASFLETAERHERDTLPLWEAIEHEPGKLAACAWETALEDIGSFLETAKRHGRNTVPLWEA
ncbi:MAG TPA: SIR2 family protein, partial [Thermoanaerobaculia bacterium]|nr:SIR2 family protein [Thermoanaerobaculia bacterium]